MTTRTMTIALAAAALCGASLQALAVDSPPATTARASVDTRAAVVGIDRRPIQWAGWQTAYTSGDRVGQVQAISGDCRVPVAHEWSDLLARRVGAELQQAFDDELARAQLAPRARHVAPLQVNAVLNDLTLNLCSSGDGRWQGGFQVQVSWKVRQAGSNRIVHEMRTRGSFTTAQATDRPPAYALRDAFAKAAHGLLANRQFVAMLQQPAATTVAAVRD